MTLRLLRHLGAFLPVAGALLVTFPASATPSGAAPLTWSPCPIALVDNGHAIPVERLECAWTTTALDHDTAADTGEITLGVIRLRAGDAQRREGAIFMNFGGPGASPYDYLPWLAESWVSADRNDPIDGPKKELTERFDLVAVVPRGLIGGDVMECIHTGRRGMSLAESSDDNAWAQAIFEADTQSRACDHPLYPYIDTMQVVEDMEHVRRAMGEPVLNFYGVSYGTWVGSRYAAAHPGTAGRFLLDSSAAFHLSFQQVDELTTLENERSFLRDAVSPALASPDRYGLGEDRDVLLARLRAMPSPWRSRLLPNVKNPVELVAAVALGEWRAAHPDAPLGDEIAWLDTADFGVLPTERQAVFEQAHALLPSVYRVSGRDASEYFGPDGIAVNRATTCNDTKWPDIDSWRSMVAWRSANLLTWNGDDVALGLLCARSWSMWSAPLKLEKMAQAPAFMMIHAEFDDATPLGGASRAADTVPNAHLVVVRGMRSHGVLGESRSVCAERDGPRFLLTGELPTLKHSECTYVPRT
ncbi:MAG: Tripeptidyl aminopeptidase [Luteibacter sp.]|uniref:alpha/beta hydrolase n=1 Tax=Luteibacter sp. TaxID=1886636 RepID=UPI0013827407|nr:alpha/beta hydrolase [Luteibacter sp.]KAF1006317.1 MAG: Tripeptidyl aminopeptidase [Luteibacter sp.]